MHVGMNRAPEGADGSKNRVPHARGDEPATIFGEPRSQGRGAIVHDSRVYLVDITLQGTFEHSDNLPMDHRTALQMIFGAQKVTAEMQMRRIFQYVFTHGGAFELYTPHILYISPDADWEIEHPTVGDHPLVMQTAVIDEIRAIQASGREQVYWTIKFAVGGGRPRSDPDDDSWWDRMREWLFGPSEPSD